MENAFLNEINSSGSINPERFDLNKIPTKTAEFETTKSNESFNIKQEESSDLYQSSQNFQTYLSQSKTNNISQVLFDEEGNELKRVCNFVKENVIAFGFPAFGDLFTSNSKEIKLTIDCIN